jgi:hypothetical protein
LIIYFIRRADNPRANFLRMALKGKKNLKQLGFDCQAFLDLADNASFADSNFYKVRELVAFIIIIFAENKKPDFIEINATNTFLPKYLRDVFRVQK